MTVSQFEHTANDFVKNDDVAGADQAPPSCNTGGEKNLDNICELLKDNKKTTFIDTFHLVWRDVVSKHEVYTTKMLSDKTKVQSFEEFMDHLIYILPDTPEAREVDFLLSCSRSQMLATFCTTPFTLKRLEKGMHGYPVRLQIVGKLPNIDGEVGEGRDINIGALCYGGNNDTVLLQVNGEGCPYIDFEKLQHFFYMMQQQNAKPRFTRIDIACDFLEGEITMEQAVTAYKEEQFKTKVQPSHSTMGDWLVDGSPKGRTLYVGNRKNSKMARIYEKGKQLGDTESKWVRVEIEFKNADTELHPTMLTDTDGWFTGAYPWCATLVQSEMSYKLKYTNVKVAHEVEHKIYHAKRCYGKLFNMLVEDADGDLQALTQVLAPGFPNGITPHVGPVPTIKNVYDAMPELGKKVDISTDFILDIQAYSLDRDIYLNNRFLLLDGKLVS